MADLSLDDYIKKDFRSRDSQGKSWKNKRLQPLLKTNSLSRNLKPMTKKPPYFSNQRPPAKQRLSSGSQNPSSHKQQVYNQHVKTPQRKPALLQFDARLKLSAKSFKDAREKIGSNVVDARHKIQNSQAKKYVQDARKKIIMNHKLNLNSQNNPKVTIMGLGKPQSFKDPVPGKMTTAGANIIRTVNNRHQSRIHPSSEVSLKRTSDERSNIATYEPLRGPVIQLKNDHYREKIPTPKSIDYDYEHLSTSGYSSLTSSARHLTSPSSPPPPPPQQSSSSSPWSLRLSQNSVLSSSSMTRSRDKYEVASNPSKSSLPLDRESLIKFPRQSRDFGVVPSATKRMKPASNVDSHDQFSSDILSNSSSSSGYRVLVTNLHPIVTQDDIIELFGAVGALKKAHLLKAGCAEVVYLSYNDAVAAVNKYHNRELDGQPMIVKMTTPTSPVFSLHSSSAIPKSLGEPLKFRKDLNSSSGANPKLDSGTSTRGGTTSQSSSTSSTAVVDVNLIHKALFSNKGSNAGSSSTAASTQAGSRPVTFTVKI
ncbi:polymerase delta-interacting protein 3 isoform X6 [Octopus sinensis]|uniref:Polymerase delta-interacting protein 3 isoform X6 n=1 Tax=Octopus sinensis TaxID=2607531 RepID=A0A6P7SEB1_9MOLL|nr:polymerase delta-interacting protein 3 isoform X6 [Octopus sinensis]